MAKVPTKTCPICGKPAVEKYRPFCSSRCADVDLNRWFTGSYVIPARDDEPADDSAIPGDDEDDNI
ncbi:DNA gyrase inhibitor YacG [Devosia sp. LC5]|uniref:DNA gyrase inhibitor YacG n=1 Tax=Devosia sp. LC5 TaxID=1502724 RepID=UPI0004E30831|nr:DNA gyrase inhibitor YacG [Devosia sp. LC5]KFC68447.1 DNA gyrase inhibitor YacG [Devosia sp. LC5]